MRSQQDLIEPLSISHWMKVNTSCPNSVLDPVRSALEKFSLAAISGGTHSHNVESIGIHFILSENTKLKPPYIGRVGRTNNLVGAGIELRWSGEKGLAVQMVQMTMCKSLLALLLGVFRDFAIAEEPFLESLSEYEPWNEIISLLAASDVESYSSYASSTPIISMNEDKFWAVIEDSKPPEGSGDDHGSCLSAQLSMLSPEDVAEFAIIFHSKMVELYRYDLWAIAYIINGGCSDDGFTYFRGWLIGHGREFYQRAILRPEFVGEQVEGNVGEEIDLIPFGVYEKKTGYEMHFVESPEPSDPIVPRWSEEDPPRALS